MIFTSNYKEWHSTIIKPLTISGDRGRDASYDGDSYLELAPKKEFWRIWKDNIGRIPEDENTWYYVRKYWETVISKLDPEKVYNDVNNSALLCYEPNMGFCHRHLVAAWLELFLNIEVPEAKAEGENIEIVERPSYIKEYLEEVIRNNLDMNNFNSIHAFYLYSKSLKLKQQLKDSPEIEKEIADLRSRAFKVEEEYNNSKGYVPKLII